MTTGAPVKLAEDKSSELENGGNIQKLARVGTEAESSDHETSTEDLGTLLRQVSKTPMDELDHLIVELQTLRRRLTADRDRIQRDIETYAGLSQHVTQLTTIITDNVKNLPSSPGISP
jgi:hypothetical protein